MENDPVNQPARSPIHQLRIFLTDLIRIQIGIGCQVEGFPGGLDLIQETGRRQIPIKEDD